MEERKEKKIDKDFIRRALLGSFLIIAMFSLISIGLYKGYRSVEDEKAFIIGNKAEAEAVVYNTRLVRAGTHSAVAIFYIGNKRYLHKGTSFNRRPPIGLSFPIWYNAKEPNVSIIAQTPYADSLRKDPDFFYERQLRKGN